jgi:hypothetical protein
MHCFACNGTHELASGERIGFRDSCAHCGTDLHACRNCLHHDPSAYNECREPNTERVSERERANRCDYFSPTDAEGSDGSAREGSLQALDSLFKK